MNMAADTMINMMDMSYLLILATAFVVFDFMMQTYYPGRGVSKFPALHLRVKVVTLVFLAVSGAFQGRYKSISVLIVKLLCIMKGGYVSSKERMDPGNFGGFSGGELC